MIKHLRLWSDIHLEFGPFNPESTGKEKETILTIAGDFAPGVARAQLEACCNTFEHVIYVPGNHEYYRQVLEDTDAAFRVFEQETANFHFLNPGCRLFENQKLRIIGGTLWTDLEGGNPWTVSDARAYMNDYRQIKRRLSEEKTFPLRPKDTLLINAEHRKFFEEELKKPFEGKTIVVSHHAPSLDLLDKAWPSHTASNPFYGNTGLEEWFDEYNIEAWFHGHTHLRQRHKIGKGNIWANPRGYVGYEAAANDYPGTEDYLVEL